MKKRARPPRPRNSARNSVRFVEQLESRLAMAAMGGDLGSSDNGLPRAEEPNSAVVSDNATNEGVTAGLCFDCAPDPPRPWTNFNNVHDVDGDGEVTPTDALVIINYINTNGPGPVPADAAASAPYLDTNSDNQIAADDVMVVVNHLHYLNLVDKISRFREKIDGEFLYRTIPDVTDLHPVLMGNASEMPVNPDGISYFDFQILFQSVSRKVYDSQFVWGSWEEAEQAVDELLSKVVDDRAPSSLGF